LRNLIRELCPEWRDIKIDYKGKYLGFVLGPGQGPQSWNSPLNKYNKRVADWEDNNCGLFWNIIYYNTFVATTLEFVAQLEPPTAEVCEAERAALRKLAPGPGNWITSADLENLQLFGIGASFRTIEVTARAAKARLLRDLGIDATRRKAELILKAKSDSLRRPFGTWHDRSYAQMLCDNWAFIHQQGINLSRSGDLKQFQKEARAEIVRERSHYDIEERIRRKIERWRFQDPPRLVVSRLIETFRILQERMPPAVRATYLRALWNGVPTSRRMRTCKDYTIVGCVFKCSERAEDSLEHYCRCPLLQDALKPLTLKNVQRLDDFFGTTKGLSDDERVECARRVRVTCRTTCQIGQIRVDPRYRCDGVVPCEAHVIRSTSFCVAVCLRHVVSLSTARLKSVRFVSR
jgi:hypothetical protein